MPTKKGYSRTIEGLAVIDATVPLTVIINKQDTHAVRKNPKKCAIAQSCVRKGLDVRVHLTRVYVKRGDKWRRYVMSPSMRTEVVAFDRGGDFQPGTYRLMPPPPTQKLGVDRGPNKTRRNAYPKFRQVKHRFENVRQSPPHA